MRGPRTNGPTATNEFVNGLERVDPIGGGCVRLTFFVTHGPEGEQERVPTDVPLVMPEAAIADMVSKLLGILKSEVIVRPDGTVIMKN